MTTLLKNLGAAALLGMLGTAHATVNVDVQVTADNAYAIYTGNDTVIYDFHGTAENFFASEIAAPETYNFTMNDGDIIYIAAWSDDATAQGLLAEFNIDGTVLTTSNSQWEVMATGIDLDFADPAPTITELTTQVNLANSGSVPSGGWVNTTLGGLNDTVWGTPGSVYVPSMASTLQWAWYHKPGAPGDTFSDGYNHDEYLVFRLEFPIGGCCLEDTCVNMTPDDCDLAGGFFNDLICENTDWTCPEDPVTGACCMETPDGMICQDISEIDCAEKAGDWFGLGTNCVDVLAECETDPDPDPDTGACCIDRPDGPECVEITKDLCKDSDGTWFGWGSLCVDVFEECMIVEEPVSGACCVKEECLDSTEEECTDLDGDFQGEDSTCLDIAVTCDDDPVSTDTDDGKPGSSSSCSSIGSGTGYGILVLMVSLMGLARRRQSA
jgi:hypothetical protein